MWFLDPRSASEVSSRDIGPARSGSLEDAGAIVAPPPRSIAPMVPVAPEVRTRRRSGRATEIEADRGPPPPTPAPAPVAASHDRDVKSAELTVFAEPYATIRLDGVLIGNTPMYRVQTTSGRHELELIHPANGTVRHRLELVLGPGEIRKVRAPPME